METSFELNNGMFTGLTTDIGRIAALTHHPDGSHLTIDGSYTRIEPGASVLHSGICLTVVDPHPGPRGTRWNAVVSPHTRSITNAATWQTGNRLNLERSLRAGDRIDGHLVYGHIDTVAKVLSVTRQGESRRLRISLPDALGDMIFSRASVALDGVSLTVAEVATDHQWFEVVLIPHTLEVTTLSSATRGYRFNVEADMICRQVAATLRRMQTEDKP